MRFSLCVKLVLMICGPLAMAYLSLFTMEYRNIKTYAVEQTKELVFEILMHAVAHLERHFEAVSEIGCSASQFVTTIPTVEDHAMIQLLESRMKSDNSASGIRLALEPDPRHLRSNGIGLYLRRDLATGDVRRLAIATDEVNEDWYSLPKASKHPVWTEPYRDRIDGKTMVCTYSVPLFRDGKFHGVIAVDLSLDSLRTNYFKEHSQAAYFKIHDPTVYFFVLSRTGRFVSHPNPSLVLNENIFSYAKERKLGKFAELGREMVAQHQGISEIDDPDTGKPRWVFFAPLKSAGLSLAVVDPGNRIMARSNEWLHWRLLKLFFGLVLAIAIVVVVSGQITRPLHLLMVSAQAVAKGNLDVEVTGVRSRDEIGQLTDTFNQMLRDLKTTIEAKAREVAVREAMQRDLQVARQIQLSLLPVGDHPFPDNHEFSLYAGNEPAHYIAGDFYDFWFIDDDTLALAIADVSGAGVPAAMFMAVCRTTLRNLSATDRSPGLTLSLANRFLAEHNDQEMFVTVFLAHYHIKTGELIFANAGHNPPYLVRKGNLVESLGMPTGPLLATWAGAEYGDKCVNLASGDVLTLYTDGVTEATNPDGEMFCAEGFERFLQNVDTSSPKFLGEAIMQRVVEFRCGDPQDDVTLLVLRRT